MVVSRGGLQTKHLADPVLAVLSCRVSGRVSGLVIKLIGRVTKLTAITAYMFDITYTAYISVLIDMVGLHDQSGR